METFRFGLLFIERTETAHPIAHVYVKNGSYGDYSGSAGDLTLLSSQALSLREFEAHVDRLHQELDTLKAEARRRFSGPGTN